MRKERNINKQSGEIREKKIERGRNGKKEKTRERKRKRVKKRERGK